MLENINQDDIEKFISDGYLCIKNAFSEVIAEKGAMVKSCV